MYFVKFSYCCEGCFGNFSYFSYALEKVRVSYSVKGVEQGGLG